MTSSARVTCVYVLVVLTQDPTLYTRARVWWTWRFVGETLYYITETNLQFIGATNSWTRPEVWDQYISFKYRVGFWDQTNVHLMLDFIFTVATDCSKTTVIKMCRVFSFDFIGWHNWLTLSENLDLCMYIYLCDCILKLYSFNIKLEGVC